MSGSQRSYISVEVKDKLKLRSIRKEKVIIKTFEESKDSRSKMLDVAQFNVKYKNKNVFNLVEALCVPKICSDLSNQRISSARSYDHVKGLQLADSEEIKGRSI